MYLKLVRKQCSLDQKGQNGTNKCTVNDKTIKEKSSCKHHRTARNLNIKVSRKNASASWRW